MPGTSSVAVGPTVMVALERRGIRSWNTSPLSVSLPPLAASWLTVSRRMSPAGTFTSKVRRRRTSMPPAPVTRTASVVRPDLAGLELEGLALALVGAERDAALEAGLRLGAGLGLVGAGDGVGAGRAFDVVDGKLEAGLIAKRQEARARDGERDGIAHDHVLAGGAELVRAPRHGVEPHGAVEVGHLELDLGRAVGADFDDAGEQRERRLDRRAALHGHAAVAAVAARAQRAALGAHAVDQAAVDVADLGAEPALAEEPVLRLGRLEAREVEDAEVGGGDRDARLLALGQPGRPSRARSAWRRT